MKKITKAILLAASSVLACSATDYVIPDYVNTVNNEASGWRTKSGLLVLGEAPDARAFSLCSASPTSGIKYAETANLYHRTFGDSVTIYCMPIPTQSAFYTPDSFSKLIRKQNVAIGRMFDALDNGVVPVNVFTILSEHVTENIYARTDHHWLPLGAYYAAKAFAAEAGVPFRDLSEYDADTVRNYVGSMYHYTKSAAVKASPEDFVYFTPRDVEYTAFFTPFSGGNTTKEPFFKKFADGSSGAYCTFMGGDNRLCKVVTSTENGRKLVVLKDSFGNAIPGYLFHSFQEIHVIDCRYFKQNLVKYVKDNGITDIVFANNLQHACSKVTVASYERYLVQ